MRPEKLDHVALYVPDPQLAAEKLLSRLPFRVLEETDEFVLVGRAPDLGKLTLFASDGPRERGSLIRVGLGVPCATTATTLELDELEIALVPGRSDGEVDLHHVALCVPEPAASARSWVDFGFEPEPAEGGAPRVRLGSALVELHKGAPDRTERPLLNHLGLLVSSLDPVQQAVEERGIEVTREVDAENSRALFVRGPDGVEVEYIEHKPSFALA